MIHPYARGRSRAKAFGPYALKVAGVDDSRVLTYGMEVGGSLAFPGGLFMAKGSELLPSLCCGLSANQCSSLLLSLRTWLFGAPTLLLSHLNRHRPAKARRREATRVETECDKEEGSRA